MSLYYLENKYLFWPRWKIIIYRLLFYFFLWSGLIICIIISLVSIKPYSYFGILLTFFFIFLVFRSRFSDYPLTEKILKKDRVNLGWFLDENTKNVLVEARFLSYYFKMPLGSSLIYVLLEKQEIITSLKYLDIDFVKIKQIKELIIQNFKNSSEITILKQKEKDFIYSLLLSALQKSFLIKQSFLNNYCLFLALFDLNDPTINNIFTDLNITLTDAQIGIIINLLSKQRNLNLISGISEIQNRYEKFKKRAKVNRSLTSLPTPTLDEFGLDYTDLAQQYRIGIMIGHNEEYKTLITVLSRPLKKCVLLIGQEGSGKETIISYLAHNLTKNNVPKPLLDFRLIKLPFTNLLQNITSPLDVTNHLSNIVREVLNNNDIILYLPDLHNYKLVTQEGGLSSLEILKPLIVSDLPLIATSTIEDYKKFLEKDSFIQDNFEIIKVNEVSEEEAIQILAFRSIDLERKEKITITYQAIKRAVFLAKRFLTNVPLPSSAEKLIHEALEGVKQMGKSVVTEKDIVDLVSVKTSIPLEISDEEDKNKLLNLEKYLHENYINQEEAVRLVASAIRQYRAGLSNPNKPIAVFLFVGPTGVGKTELAKNLAQVYFGSVKTMIRFDMSEYQDQRGIFRFIGDPEGTTRGALTEAVKDKPFSLILLDEFEKAHPKVLDLFLPLFDEGRLTDNLGEVIDFTNTIIIATSNALSDYIKKQIEIKVPFKELTDDLKKKLTNYFKPELINRFDEIVVFKPLTEDNLKQIVKLKLNNLTKILQNKNISVDFDDSVINKIAQLGYNPVFGARPLDSVISHYIKDRLAQVILKGEIKTHSKIHFIYRNNNFEIITLK
jgi:ATP-dependent Clp protease ATP-binding subunit ClpC